MVTPVVAMAGMLVVAGVWLAMSGLARRPVKARPARSKVIAVPDRSTPAGQLRVEQIAGAAAGALVALLVTRWPVAGAAGAAAGWVAVGALRRGNRRAYEARTEALALWAEMLRDAIGTARGIEGVLVATAATSPEAIRPAVTRMAGRLPYEALADVLDDLAHDLDHPIGDLVVTSLRLTSTSGGRQIREVLTDLADTAHAEASGHRRIAVARARPQATMRYTAMLITGFVVLLVLVSGDYLEAYATVAGQVVLCGVGFYWGLGFWWMSRMGRPAEIPRYLVADGEGRGR